MSKFKVEDKVFVDLGDEGTFSGEVIGVNVNYSDGYSNHPMYDIRLDNAPRDLFHPDSDYYGTDEVLSAESDLVPLGEFINGDDNV